MINTQEQYQYRLTLKNPSMDNPIPSDFWHGYLGAFSSLLNWHTPISGCALAKKQEEAAAVYRMFCHHHQHFFHRLKLFLFDEDAITVSREDDHLDIPSAFKLLFESPLMIKIQRNYFI